MPKRRTDDVVHVVMTDHLIQRRPPSRDLLAELAERHPTEAEEYRGEVVPYYPSNPDALYRALAQVILKNNLRAGVVELARLIGVRQPREPIWHMQLGDAWLASGEPLKAVAAYEQAVRLSPRSVSALQALARAFKASGQAARSAETLEKAIRIAPSDARSWYQSGVLSSDPEKMQKAIAIDPDLPRELDAAITKLLEPDPGARHQCAAELSWALSEVLALPRTRRRRRIAGAVAASCTAGLCLVVLGRLVDSTSPVAETRRAEPPPAFATANESLESGAQHAALGEYSRLCSSR
jgi:tetratricopeptide (TPR) repeat protein